MTKHARIRVLAAITLVSLAVWALWPRQRAPEAERLPVEEPAPSTRARSPRSSYAPPATPRGAARHCTSGAEVRCYRGDVWSFDSCGDAEEKLDECEARACEDATCAPEPDAPCDEPAEGRCVGDRVRLCLAGVLQEVDCASRGLACVEGNEGADCAKPVPPEEACPESPVCEGDVLIGCAHGRKTRTACATLGARCGPLERGKPARCIAALPSLSLRMPCGPCGCTGDPLGEARCDMLDDDRDGVIDEGAECGPVNVVAFLVGDDMGNSSHAEEDVAQELARVNALFAARTRDRAPTFVLDRTVNLNDGRLGEIDEDELSALANASSIQEVRDGFYVPVLFTDRVVSEGGVPKAGLSTLPNGTCGGVQLGLGPDFGIVAVAKGRSPSTLAHEIGHFLGLCHTHEQLSDLHRTYTNELGQASACEPSCAGDGDGICDTLPDPGIDECKLDASCFAQCSHGELAPADNVMSYYTPCRSGFTPEQVRLVQRTIALRRGWQPCLRGVCPCMLGGNECPSGMACRLVASTNEAQKAQCMLVGSAPPGTECDDARQCAGESLCIQEERAKVSLCARTCRASTLGCTCEEVEPGIAICSEDVKARS